MSKMLEQSLKAEMKWLEKAPSCGTCQHFDHGDDTASPGCTLNPAFRLPTLEWCVCQNHYAPRPVERRNCIPTPLDSVGPLKVAAKV